MENNENNVQNQEKKQSKGLSVGLVIITLITVLIIGIGGGYLLSKNDSLFNKNETKSNNTTDNSKNENKVISVVSVEDSSEMVKRQMTIEGRDKDNNRVWSYTTLAENIPQEVINRGLKLIETRNGKVYLCDWGKLYILDEQTGKVLAQNTEHNMGAAAVYIFDENDNLYTTSYLAAVDKFDTNAKLLKTTDSKIWDKGFYWPKKMTLNGNNLVIDYGDEGSVTVNKETLEIIDAKNNTNTQQNQTTLNNNSSTTTSDYNTAITEIKKCLKDVNWLKEKEMSGGYEPYNEESTIKSYFAKLNSVNNKPYYVILSKVFDSSYLRIVSYDGKEVTVNGHCGADYGDVKIDIDNNVVEVSATMFVAYYKIANGNFELLERANNSGDGIDEERTKLEEKYRKNYNFVSIDTKLNNQNIDTYVK